MADKNKGESFFTFRSRTNRKLRVLMCTVWKHRRHLGDHRLRLEVAEERLDLHEKSLADLRRAGKLLARVQERHLEEERSKAAKKPPRRRG
jgi:hypothetical protein